MVMLLRFALARKWSRVWTLRLVASLAARIGSTRSHPETLGLASSWAASSDRSGLDGQRSAEEEWSAPAEIHARLLLGSLNARRSRHTHGVSSPTDSRVTSHLIKLA